MKSNHALAGLAIVVLGGAAWLTMAFFGSDDREPIVEVPSPAPIAAESPVELEGSAQSQSQAAPEETRTALAATVETEVAGWDSDLGGLIGRVVEEDMTPVADISVALVQVDANLFLAADWTALGEAPPELVIGRTMTDEEGRFRLAGAYDASFQGISVDLRGPRSTIRVVDTQLHHGEVTDIGDIVLSAGCTIFGRVVDPSGAPVPEARVRVIPSPPGEDLTMFLQAGVQDFRADCSVGISKMIVEEIGTPVIELPPIVRNHLDDLPIPSTTTNAEGEYRIEGVPIGDLILGVDKPDWVGVSRVVTTTAGEVELEDAALSVGQTIRGFVVDREGEPLAGIEVIAGSEFVFGEAAILHPAGVSASDGSFSIRGCPETNGIMACARRNPDEQWVGALEAPGEELEIELASTIAVTVHVVDAAGEPVGGARVDLSPGVDMQSPMGMAGLLMDLGGIPRDARLVEKEPGTYFCAQVTPGRYELTARSREYAVVRQQVELVADQPELTVTCATGMWLDLTVIDAETGAGIPGARASIVGAGFPFLSALAVGRTAKDGRVRLGPYTVHRDASQPRGIPMEGRQVLVQHPRFADSSALLVDGTQETVVALIRGGEIHGQIVWGADPPLSVYMLILENKDGAKGIMEAFLPPRLGRSDLTGAFRFTNLPPGIYELTVMDRFLDKDPIMLIMGQQEPTIVHKEAGVMLEPSGRADLLIDLSPSGRGQTARIAGSVTVDLSPVAGATVRVSGGGPGAKTETDSRGNFETPDFLAAKEVYVQITGDIETPNGLLENVSLHSGSLTPVPQTVHRLDLDLQSHPLDVKVTLASGEPVAGATVVLQGQRGSKKGAVRTDAQGHAELLLVGESSRTVNVAADGFAPSTAHVDPSADGFKGVVEVELAAGVVCAGLADLTAFDSVGTGNGVYLRVTGAAGGTWERLDQADLGDDSRASFRVEGLRPGSYEANLWMNGTEAKAITIELPEGGDENVLLTFEPVE